MDIMQIRCFLRVYQDKKIARAAERLFISQQNLSRVIKRLEEELGVILFTRTKSGLFPTHESETVYKYVKTILENYDNLHLALAQGIEQKKGTLETTMDLGIVQILTPKPMLAFSDKYPRIDLVLHEHRDTTCEELVSQGKVDLGLSIRSRPDANFDYRPICTMFGEVLVNRSHPYAEKDHITIEDLIAERILFSGSASYYSYLREFEGIGHAPNIMISTTESNAALAYLQNNSGGVCPVIYLRNRTLPQYPPEVVAVPYQSKEKISLYGYVNEDSKSELGPLFINFLQAYYR